MTKNLYVGNLSFEITGADLESVFGEYGGIRRAQVIVDRDTGRSKGFGFVEMSDGGDAAIAALNGAEWGGRTLKVNEAKAKTEGARRYAGRT